MKHNEKKGVVVGIDASSIRGGGGLEHLVQILNHVDIKAHNISKIIVWCNPEVRDSLPSRDGILVVSKNYFKNPIVRMISRYFLLAREIEKNADVVFFPAGISLPVKIPAVGMCQNIQPFIQSERKNQGLTYSWLRLVLLRILMRYSLKSVDRVIFVSEHALHVLEEDGYKRNISRDTVIGHGCDDVYFSTMRTITEITEIIYVSTINTYKHQVEVAKAVAICRDKGTSLSINFVGGWVEPYYGYAKKIFNELDPGGEWIKVSGKQSRSDVVELLKQSDLFVFASTCETFGMAVVEAMAVGLPIICSDAQPMSGYLKDGAVKYFNPNHPEEIAAAIQYCRANPDELYPYRKRANQYAKNFRWSLVARSTFDVIVSVC